MAYRITVDPVAEAGIKALSTSARRALSEVLTVLSEVPWNGEPTSRDNPGGAVRRFLFGPGGAGMVVYLIVEDDRWVDVLQVHWLG